MKKPKKNISKGLIQNIKNHILKNIKDYILVGIIFLIGVVIGVIFINKIENGSKEEIKNYISTFTNAIKTSYQINSNELLKTSIINNGVYALIIWFMGSTVIGIPIVYIMTAVKGFSLGYTISAILITFKSGKGIIFAISSLLMQNLLIIPCTLALAVSGIKLYRSIMKDKRKENIKIEIVRHTIFSAFILILLIVSSFIETYISANLVSFIIQFV